MRPGDEGQEFDLASNVKESRRRLPKSHQALIEQIGVQDAVVDDWPEGVQAIYRSVLMAPPSARELSRAVAAWLPAPRVVAYNGPLLAQVFDEVIANVYALMIGRVVQYSDYGTPDFLNPQVFEAFESVVPWPPSPR